MTKLIIFDWDKLKREVDFIGYNSDHTICYIDDQERAKQALILKLPHRFNLQFRKNPISDFPPTSITRAILRLPTCFASEKEMQIFEQPSENWPAFVKTLPLNEQLKLAYPHKMYVAPEDETKLDGLLAKETRRLHQEHQERKRQVESLPPRQREKELRALDGEFTTEVRDYLSCSLKTINALNVTLEDAKHGALGLREKMLHEEYAQKIGLNPATILAEARRFRSWIERTAISVNQLDEAKWMGLEMCVHYEIAFFDGSRCWLNEVKQTGLTDPKQLEEFDRLEAAAQVARDNVPAQMAGPAVDLQSSKPSTQAESEAGAKAVYQMSFAGSKRWKITFGTYEPFFATDNGIGRELAYVLKHRHTEFHVLDVQHEIVPALKQAQKPEAVLGEGLSSQSGTHQIRHGKLNPEAYARAKEKLNGDLEAARASGDTLRIEEIEHQISELERYQAEARHPVKDWAKRCNDRFRTGLKRFKTAVGRDRTPGSKAFLEHLKKHLTFARFKIRYHPPEGFNWTD